MERLSLSRAGTVMAGQRAGGSETSHPTRSTHISGRSPILPDTSASPLSCWARIRLKVIITTSAGTGGARPFRIGRGCRPPLRRKATFNGDGTSKWPSPASASRGRVTPNSAWSAGNWRYPPIKPNGTKLWHASDPRRQATNAQHRNEKWDNIRNKTQSSGPVRAFSEPPAALS